jgi:hypothetical protein
MELKEEVRVARSTSSASGRRVSSAPPATAAAALATSATGRISRVLAHRPTTAPTTVVARPAKRRASPRKRRVRSSWSKLNTSKYDASTPGSGRPTARTVAPASR